MFAGAAREASIVSYIDNQTYTQMAGYRSGASISSGSTNGGHPLKNDHVISVIGGNVGVCQNTETEFHTLRLDENGVFNFDANSCQIVQHGCPPEKQVPNGLSNICNGSSESVAGTVSLRRGQVCAERFENVACDTDLLSSGSNRLEDRISEKHDHGPTSNTAGDVSGKNRSGHFKVCSRNQQTAVKEKGMLVSHTTPTIALVPDRDSSNTFMLKINNGPIVVRSRQKQKRREYSLYNVPMPGTFISTVSQTSKPPQTKVDCVKSASVNPTASSRHPYYVRGNTGSEGGAACLNTFQNNELAQTNTHCGRRITLPKSRLSVPSSGNGGGNDTTDYANSDSQCPVFVNSDLPQKHGDCQTRTVLSVSHHQQPVREHEADGVILTAPAEPIPDGDHTEKGRLPQMDVAPTLRVETKEVPLQEEVLKPYCDCPMSTFTEDMAKACTISYQGLPVRLPHVSSVIIREHQLASFARNGKLYVSVSELKSKNMIHNFTRFSSLLRSQSRLLPLAKTEVEFLKQRGRVKDSKNARLVSLDHLRWIYQTLAAQQQDAFNTAVSQCPWYSLTLGHSCPKVSKLNQTQDYVCPLCLRVEQRPIEATTQRYECALCFQANESPSVPQLQIPIVSNYVNKTKKMEQTSFMVREDGKMQNVKVGHMKVAEKNVAAFRKGDVSYVNCRHLVVHLYQFPWENFVSLVKSLDLCFMEAPLPVCHFFQRRAYPPELVNGRVWCSVQNLRCIACFSVGQMNNTQYLEKNKVLALIAQGKYVEEFLSDDRGGETEKILTEPKRALPSCEYQVHNSQVRTTNSSATHVRETPPDQMVVKIDATTGQILVCRGRVKSVGNLNLSQTVAQSRTRTDDQTGLNFDANGGQSVVGGGGVINSGKPSQVQTLAQSRTEQMGVNLDASSQIVVGGDTTTYARPSHSELGIQSRSLLTQRNSVERRPAVAAKTVFCCEMSQIPSGNYFAKENINFTDYESESGLVFRVMKQPTVAQNRVDILSIAAEEIREVAYTSPYTTDLDKTRQSDPVGSSCNQSFQASSFEQCSNLQQLMSEQKTQPQAVLGLDVTTNVTTVCKDVRTEEPTLVSSVDMHDNNHVSDGQENLLSMPVDFFQDSLGSPKRKHFLSPSKMGHVTKPGGEVIMVQSESGERYECTALCLIDELKDCMLVVSPVKEKKENQNVTPQCGVNLMDSLKTISPHSACSEKSVDSGISEGRSELCTPVERGSPISLKQCQKGLTVSQVDSLTNAEQSGSGNLSQACSVESAKNIKSMTEQTSGVTPLVDEADRTEQTSEVTPLADEAEMPGVKSLVDENDKTEQTSGVTPLADEADRTEQTSEVTPLVDEADRTEQTSGVTPLADEAEMPGVKSLVDENDKTEQTSRVTPLVDETDNTEPTSGVTPLVDEADNTDTSGVGLEQVICFNMSQSSETNEAEPSNTSLTKPLDTPFSSPTGLSITSPSVISPVITNIYKKLVTHGHLDKSNSPNSLSVLASVAEAIDDDVGGEEDGTEGDSCKVQPVTGDNQPRNDSGSVVPEDDSSTDGRSNVSEDEATVADTEEDSSPLLMETQSNSAEDEAIDSDMEVEASRLLQATRRNSDTSSEGEDSGGDTEEDSPLLQATQNTSNTPAEDEAMGSDTFGSVCSGGSQSSSDTQDDNDSTNGGCKPTVLQDPGDLIVPNNCNHPAMCVQGDKLAKRHSDKSSNSSCHNNCGHGERLSASDTDYSSSSGLPHGGEDGSLGTSYNSIEKEIEIFAELDLQLQTLIQNQDGRKFSAASEKQPKCSEDLNKYVEQKDDTKMQMVKVLERSPPLRHQETGKRNPLCHHKRGKRNLQHQETEVKAAESARRSNAKEKDDLEIVTNESWHQHQTSERIKETDPEISLLFDDETKGTDLCNGGSVEPDEAVERKTKKRKRSQSVHKGVKRRKEEMEHVIKGLCAKSNHPSSKSQNILRTAETLKFSVGDESQQMAVEAAVFSENTANKFVAAKSLKFSEGDESQQIAVEAAVFSENTANTFVAAKSQKFSEGDEKDHTSAETLNSSESATKEDIEDERSRDAGEEGLTDHAVEKMKRVLEMVQVDGLVIAPDRLRFNLNLQSSLHKHFKGETQKKLVDKLSRLVKIGYILQQRRQKADGAEQTSTSVES